MLELLAMGRIDPRWLRAARLAGATLMAVGAVDVVVRGSSLSRNEDGAILLAAGVALLALHVVLSRRGGRDSTDALLAAALAVPFVPVGVALLAYSPPSAASFFTSDALRRSTRRTPSSVCGHPPAVSRTRVLSGNGTESSQRSMGAGEPARPAADQRDLHPVEGEGPLERPPAEERPRSRTGSATTSSTRSRPSASSSCTRSSRRGTPHERHPADRARGRCRPVEGQLPSAG